MLLGRPPRQRNVYLGLRGIKAVVHCFWHSVEPIAAPPTSPFMALQIDPLAVRAQFFLLAVLRSAASRISFFCLEVLTAAVQKFSQRGDECHPPPIAVAAVFLLRFFCQTPWEFLQATGGNDNGKGQPKTGDQ